jgi:hypothetical protein
MRRQTIRGAVTGTEHRGRTAAFAEAVLAAVKRHCYIARPLRLDPCLKGRTTLSPPLGN